MTKSKLSQEQVIDVIDKLNILNSISRYDISVDELLTSLLSMTKLGIVCSETMNAEDASHMQTSEILNNKLLNSNKYAPTIPELKKRIKYCRNPMERKQLQLELNMAYKEQKKR